MYVTCEIATCLTEEARILEGPLSAMTQFLFPNASLREFQNCHKRSEIVSTPAPVKSEMCSVIQARSKAINTILYGVRF
jgi:hypothetical protein